MGRVGEERGGKNSCLRESGNRWVWVSYWGIEWGDPRKIKKKHDEEREAHCREK